MAGEQNRDRWRRYWDKTSPSYDKQMRFYERVLLGDSRSWVCDQATGDTLEVAVGTGLNLPFYPAGVELTGIDFSPAMLGVAQTRARQLGRTVDLRQADAHALPFSDALFDTVVCTFALCAIPDERRAVGEMIRVLRPGGLLLLADHIAGATWPVRAVQRGAEVVTVPLQGEHMLRRPLRQVQAEGLQIERRGSSSGSWNGSPPANPPLDSAPGRGAHPATPSRARIAEFLPLLLDLRDSAGRNRGGEGYLKCWNGIALSSPPREGP